MKQTPHDKHKEAKAVYDKIQDIVANRDKLVWLEAQMWYELKQNGLYKYVYGESIDGTNEMTWQGFIRESGVPMSTAEMKVRLWEYWVEKWHVKIEHLSQIHTRKLDRSITPILTGKKTLADVIDSAKVLPFEEFKLWLKE